MARLCKLCLRQYVRSAISGRLVWRQMERLRKIRRIIIKYVAI
jgi:hypothetical protein